VAQPHQHGRPLEPEIAETHLVGVLIRQDEIGQRIGALGRLGPLALWGRPQHACKRSAFRDTHRWDGYPYPYLPFRRGFP
jgi:hypothetical protein